MADQNPQINQNVNTQNENDELFGGSDDIFENSDLLQPINSEVDTAHQVIKSQNDLNNFSGEVQSNNVVVEPQQNTYSESKLYIQNDTQDEEVNQLKNPNDTQEESNDLFEETPYENIETNNEFDNLYNENGNIENQSQENNYTDNDDIFDESPVASNEPIEEIPEIEDISENDQQSTPDVSNETFDGPATDYNENIEEIPEIEDLAEENSTEVQDRQEVVEQPEIVESPEIVDQPDSEKFEEVPQNTQEPQEEEEFDNIDELDDIDDDIDEIKDREDDDENTDEGKKIVDNTGKIEESKNDTEDDNENDVEENNEDDLEEDLEENNEDDIDVNDEEVEEGFVQNNKENNDEEDFDPTNNIHEEDEEVVDSSDDDIENIVVQDYEKYDPDLYKTDVQKKFGELQWKTEKIHELVGKDQDVGFDLLGGNDDRQKIIYKILSGNDYVEIEKEELNKEDESTTTNVLSFELREDLENNMSLQLFVNDIELYDEIKDLQNDPNKKMQVLEKMNKFIFLLDEEYKKIQKYKKEKEERNVVKGVFRNF